MRDIRRTKMTFILAMYLLTSSAAWAQAHSVSELSWMTGGWSGQVGPADGQQRLEEVWNRPHAGTMDAVVRMTNADQTVFIELITIVNEGDGVMLHMRQFDEHLVPRFDPAQKMQLVKLEENRASFEAVNEGGLKKLTYHRDGDKFSIDVVLSEGTAFTANLTAN